MTDKPTTTDQSAPVTELLDEPIEKARHPFMEAWDMFRRNQAALVALIILVLIIIAAIIGPSLYGRDPFEMVWAPFTPPGQNPDFILGTDYLGRDLLAICSAPSTASPGADDDLNLTTNT